MRPRIVSLPASLAAALVAFVSTASAITVSGTLGPQYGSPLSIQATQTNAGFVPQGQIDYGLGQQLDMAYGYVSGGVLYLFFTGNLSFSWNIEGQTMWLPFDVFIDCAPGGQHQLLSNNPNLDVEYDLNNMSGLEFDAGFDADYWLSFGGNSGTWPHLQAYFGALPTAGGGAGAYLGTTLAGPPGVLSGGTNPNGIQVTMDDRNTLSIGAGCGAGVAPAVATGIEWAIPLAAVGNPTGCIRVCAMLSCDAHSCISNQVLGPVPPGQCGFVPASATDFSGIPGDQFFTVCPAATPVRHGSWGTLKMLYR